MKIDWDKARLIAAHRFEDIITACNRRDEDDLRCFMESGLATPEEYMIEDDAMKLDEKGCFIYKGFVCQICDCYQFQKCTDDGVSFYTCRVAVHSAIEKRPFWEIVPYMLYSIPSDNYTDNCGLLSAIYVTIADKTPATYEEMEKYELV